MAICGGDGIESINFSDPDQQAYYSARLDELSGEDAESLKEEVAKNTVEVHSVNTQRYAPYVVEGFTASQHMQVVDSMKWDASQIMKEWVNQDNNDPSQGVPEPTVTANMKRGLETARDRQEDLGNEEKAQEFQKILNNFEEFWSETKKEFEDLGLRQEQGHFYPASGSLHNRHFWEDMGRFLVSEKNTASSNVKVAMSFIPKVDYKTDESGEIQRDENGTPITEPKRNYLGMPSFYRMSEAWNLTANLLADSFPRTPESMLETLREIGEHNSTALQVWKKINSQPDKVKRDFANALGKHYAKFQLVFGTENKDGSYAMRPIRSDRLSREQALLSKWRDDFMAEQGVTYRDQNGVYRVDQDQIRDIKSSLEDISSRVDRSSKEYRDLLQRAMSKVGISLPGEYLRAAQEGEAGLRKGFDFEFGQLDSNGNFKQNSLLGRVFDALLEPRVDETGNELEGDPKATKVNPSENAVSAPALRNIARTVAPYQTSIWAASFTNVENKRLYALQDHEPLTRNFARLQDFSRTRRLIQDPFRSHSPLLRKLVGARKNQNMTDETLPNSEEDMGEIEQTDREELLERIEFGYIDGISIQGQRNGQTIENLSPRDHEIEKISFFQNQGRDERIFQGPTLSDKTRSYTLTLPSYQSHYNSKFWSANIDEENGDATLEIQEGQGLDIKEALYDAALSEISRISRTQEWLENNNAETHPQGRSYVEAAQLFHLFPELNEHNIQDQQLREAIWMDGRLKDPTTNRASRQAIKQILINKAQTDVVNQYREWKSQGMQQYMNEQYMQEQTPFSPGSERGLMYAALDQYVNYKAFYTDAMRMMHFDPAEASKWSENQDPETTVELTLGNFQKRLGGSMSPGITSGMDPQSTFDKATLLDRFVTSEFIEDHKQVFKDTVGVSNADAYSGIESTDAQEYVTMYEYLEVSHAYGQISADLKNRIQSRIENKTQQGEDYTLSDDEMEQILFQPHKPVYFGQRWDSDLGQMFQVYTKSSAFPLIPQITKGTQLDELRKAMEGQKEGFDGVDRVAYQSADKLGAVSPKDVYNSNGDIQPNSIVDALDSSKQTLSREGFGLQFLVPNKADKVPMQTQLNKLFMADITDAEGIDAESVWERKSEIRQRMFEIKREQLEDRLGAEQMDDGSYKLDPESLKEIILQEAEQRDWNPVFIQEIESLTSGEIDNMLSFTGASSMVESLLLSLVEDIVKPDMHGRAYVQQSSAGLQWESTKESGNVAFAPDFEAETGLDFIHTEDGEVQAAEIVVGWHFKDENGNPIPMDDFTTTNEQGDKIMDMEKIEEDLLNGVGYRIPYQGPNSTLPFKIVGFMPPETGVQAFVPDDIVTQMGSDFDVDKLYSYLRQYRVDNGKLVGIDENASELDQLKEEYIETLEEVLYNSSDEVQAQIRKPLDQNDLKDEIGRIQDEVGQRGRRTFTHFDRQTNDYIKQKAGKDLIGITSLWSQLESVLEHHDVKHNPGAKSGQVKLSARVRAPGRGTRTVTLDSVGGPADVSSITSGRISLQDAIRLFQNAAVDNAKENILGPLGINAINANAAMHMLLMNNGNRGFDLEHVTRLMNQPIVRDTISRAREIQSIFSIQSPFQALNTAIEEIAFEKETNGWPPVSSKDFATLPLSGPVEGTNEPNLLEDMERQPGNRQWQSRQMEYLQFLNQLNMQASDMNTLRDAFMYGDRNGAGSSLLDADTRFDKIFNLPNNNWDNLIDVGGNIRITDDHASQAEFVPETELGHSTQESVILAREMFYDNFGYGNTDFQNAIDTVESNKGRDLSSTEKENIFKDYKSFVIAGAYSQANTGLDETLGEMRQRLLFGNENQEDLASRILEARAEGWGRDRLILDFLDIETPDYQEALEVEREDSSEVKPKPAQVDFRYMKMEDQDQMRLLHSVAEMLSSPRDVERELMRDIVLYTVFARGRQHSPSTMADLVPPQFMEELGITSALRDVTFEGENRTWHQEIFKTQYMQHNPDQAYRLSDTHQDVLPGAGSLMRSHFNVKDSKLSDEVEEVIDNDPETEIEKALSDLFSYDAEGKIQARDFISMYDQNAGRRRLWEYMGDGQYEEIPTLGSGTGRTAVDLEYNVQSRRADSVILPQNGVKKIRKAPQTSTRNTASPPPRGQKGKPTPPPPGSQEQPTPPPPSGQGTPQGKAQKEATSPDDFSMYVKSDTENLTDVLKNINRDSDLPESIREVSRVLVNITSGSMQNVEVELVNDSSGPQGGFIRGQNKIGLNNAAIDTSDSTKAAKVTLHESIHAVTNSQIESYQQIQDGEVSRSESSLTDLQYRALSDLDSLHQVANQRVKDYIRNETDYSVSEIDQMVNRTLDLDDDFAVSNIPDDAQVAARRRYGVWNMREFTSHLMSEPDFQRWASGQNVDNELNIPQRFAQIIQRVIRAFADKLDIDNSRPTLLSRGVESVILSVGFNQGIQQGSRIGSSKVVSKTKYNDVFILKMGDGSRKVVNSDGNALNADNQQRILDGYDSERGPSSSPPSSGRSATPSPPGDPTNFDQRIPESADIQESIQDYSGTGRREMDETVGEFINSLSDKQRQTFRNLRNQIRTRCD